MKEIFACPACHGELEDITSVFHCRNCGRQYPFRFGLPDFRLSPDPYIGIEEEVKKVHKILGENNYSFEQLVERYYENTPEVSVKLQPRYIQGLKAGAARAENFLNQMEKAIQISDGPILDLGCGTAGLTLVAARRYGVTIVGVDIALRWLVIGKQRLKDADVDADLVCASAEALPFKDGAFTGVISDSAVEHVLDTSALFRELRRVTCAGGFFYLNTANRNSLLEAYTGFPAPGLLPRRLRLTLIESVCKTPYKLNPLSARELRRLLTPANQLQIGAFKPFMDHHSHGSNLRRRLASLYGRMVDSPLGNRFLRHFGLFLSASGYF